MSADPCYARRISEGKPMITNLLPCPSCGRHVRRTAGSCPFCATSIAEVAAAAPVRAAPSQRLGRAATFAFGAAAIGGGALAGCTGAPVPLYGGPADSGPGTDAPPAVDAGEDGGLAPMYGGPTDAGDPGTDAGDPAVDAGGPAPAYGGPIPVDAGPDTGALVTLYGGAP